MGGPVAAGLLLAVVAFALAFVGRAMAAGGIAACAAAALAVMLAEPGPAPAWVFAGCWSSLVIAAFLVYFPQGLRRWPWLALALAANAGAWATLVVAVQGTASAVLPILGALALVIPATVCVARGWTLGLRIVTSWLLAVALLVGAIPYLVVHPGYVADHNI